MKSFNINAAPFIPIIISATKEKYEVYINTNTKQLVHLMETSKNVPKYLKKIE